MAEKNFMALADELRQRIPTNGTFSSLNVDVFADEDGIYCAPAESGIAGYPGSIHYVEEIVLFAKYHDLSVITEVFDKGAGLKLW